MTSLGMTGQLNDEVEDDLIFLTSTGLHRCHRERGGDKLVIPSLIEATNSYSRLLI